MKPVLRIRPLTTVLAVCGFLTGACDRPPAEGGAGDGGETSSVDAALSPVSSDSLSAGSTYRLSAPTPILPDPDPGDPTMTMVETVTLPSETMILVVRRLETAGVLWYEIRGASDAEITGWVSLPGLGDQRIEPVR